MKSKLQKARKDHYCLMCDRRIPKGVKYWRDYDEGRPDYYKEHTNCEEFKSQPTEEEAKEQAKLTGK